MTRLTVSARETLSYAGLTSTQWARLHGYEGARAWRGDACGCTDDRCVGHHHDESDECGCLPALIEDYLKQQRASFDGRGVWASHVYAIETGRADDRAAADGLAVAWITQYHPGAIAHSFSETPRGITYRNRWNDTTWLVFDAELGEATVVAMDGPMAHFAHHARTRI